MSCAAFWLLFALLETVFSLFAGRTASVLLSLLPALLLLFLLQKTASPTLLTPALIAAAAFRLFFAFVPRRDLVIVYGCILPDALAMYLYLSGRAFSTATTTDKILFASLAIMTLAALQQLLCGPGFPFHYFALLGLLLLSLPMGPKPIDWSPVVQAGEILAHRVMEVADGVTYRFSSLFDSDSYTAGYSSFDVTGSQISGSESTQLLLHTGENPYHTYEDPETGSKIRVRRTLYLAGARGVDKQQLVAFLRFLHSRGVDRAYARLFSEISSLSVEYVYLDTADEIAPAGSIRLTSSGQNITSGTSNSLHRKGYQLQAQYLDIDYGSPYLIGLYRSSSPAETTLSYDDACEYAHALYGIKLSDILTSEEYESGGVPGEVPGTLSVSGASERLADLAQTITANASNNYDKCRLIESYLRQFTYSTTAEGGHDPHSDMSTAAGMADIADRFLFETGTGYCVQYTSSMVMLLRLSGIPARVAKGYRYVFPLEKQDSYKISANCAHAWPEAYLGDAGWVPFEPTTSYRTSAAYTWHRVAADEAPATVPGTTPSAEPEFPAEPSVTPALRLIRIALPVALSVLFLLAALIAGTRAIARLRYNRATPVKRLQMDVEMIKKIIRKQSADDFVDRGLLTDYVEHAPAELQSDVQKVFAIYYRVIYGGDTIVTEEESELARRVRGDRPL